MFFSVCVHQKLPQQVVVDTFHQDGKDLDQHLQLSCDSHNTVEHITVAPSLDLPFNHSSFILYTPLL